MNKIVVKFGGSNLKSNSDIEKIIQVVKSYKQDLVIVVSALFGVTDKLVEITKVISDESLTKEITEDIFHKYQQSLEYFTTNNQEQEYKLREQRINFETLLEVYKANPKSLSTKNAILSFGEKLSAFILNAILNLSDIHCELALPEDFNLKTNNKLNNASISNFTDLEQIKTYFDREKHYVVPGFYGISPKGEIALFGRGGSDYTAAILAYALDADSLDLWKDVSAYLSADPKIVNQPIEIEKLNYLEAAELSYFGAKIIHPGTIRPLLKKEIPLNIYSIHAESYENKRGTQIANLHENSSSKIKSITYNNRFVLLKLKGSGVGIKKGILNEITQLFDQNDINIRSVITSQIEIDFLLHKDDLEKAYTIAKTIQNHFYDLEIEKDISLIACVGDGIKQSAGIAGKIFGALATDDINIKHIIFGASDVALYLIVAQNDLQVAINNIHNKVFEK